MSYKIPRSDSMTSSVVSRVCGLCCGTDCPAVDSMIGVFGGLPNEVTAKVLSLLSLESLSVLSITSKWFRDFILNLFIESTAGLQSLIRQMDITSTDPSVATDWSPTSGQHKRRLESYKRLGLLLKRLTCLLPTNERLDLLIKVLDRIQGFPNLNHNQWSHTENQKMRSVFESFGYFIHKVIAGWDDLEVDYVFQVLQTIANIEQRILLLRISPLGARKPNEYYVRCFYRLVCIDPTHRYRKTHNIEDTVFWLNHILKPHSLQMRAKLLLIIYGPLITVSPPMSAIPYIGWWDLTDTFFINNGLEELGFALYMLYSQSKTHDHRNEVINLLEEIIKIPQNWLSENMASLLFFAGDDITYMYLLSKIRNDSYAEVAQKLVYLTLIEHKLTKSTKIVYKLIEKLCESSEQKRKLMNELPIAFCEAVTDIDGAIDMEDERDVTEIHEIIAAMADLMKNSLLNNFKISKESNTSDDSDSDFKEE